MGTMLCRIDEEEIANQREEIESRARALVEPMPDIDDYGNVTAWRTALDEWSVREGKRRATETTQADSKGILRVIPF